MIKNSFIYRYRSIEKLFKFNELENLEIYFSKPEELNDQMEDYLNIFWQGDEIAFQGLFKHYLHTLYKFYTIALLTKPSETLDIEHLPIFIQYKDLSLPYMQTTFKAIYEEFFDSESISDIPKQMAKSSRKYSADEILVILKTIHLYAYLVINNQVKKDIYGINLLAESQYREVYEFVKFWKEYGFIIDRLNSQKESLNDQINNLELQHKLYEKYLDNLYSPQNTYKIKMLTFSFPILYINQIKKLLYNNHCVACFSDTFQNEPMWSHYASSENGICLRYKTIQKHNAKFINLHSTTSSFLNENCDIQVKKDFYLNPLYKVVYSNEYPEIDFFKSLGCIAEPVIYEFWLCNYDKTQFSSCINSYRNIEKWREEYHIKATKYICTKSKNWKYEKEYRVFQRELLTPIFENKNNRLVKYRFQDLDAIIFGRKVSSDDKKRVIKIIQKHCKDFNSNGFKFYDLYYSTITKQLELKACNDYMLSEVKLPKIQNEDVSAKTI